MKQGGTFEAIVPCKIVYSWHPEERETASEPGVDEEFNVESIMLCGLELVRPVSSYFDTCLEDAVQWYLLKEAKEELS